MLEGFRIGSAGTRLTVGALCTAMRTAARSYEIAELALRHRDEGVVGFDIAGAEAGHPPSRHLDAFQLVMRENFHITIHAGEAFGLPSIAEALALLRGRAPGPRGPDRRRHRGRCRGPGPPGPPGRLRAGPAGAAGDVPHVEREHRRRQPRSPSTRSASCASLRFRVTVNTDNRLMSDVTLTDEFTKLRDAFGYTLGDMEWLTLNAMKSAFWPFEQRLKIINELIKPGYAALRDAHL